MASGDFKWFAQGLHDLGNTIELFIVHTGTPTMLDGSMRLYQAIASSDTCLAFALM